MPTSVARRQLSWLGTTSPQLHWHQLRSDPSSVAQKAVGSTSVASRPPLLSQVSSMRHRYNTRRCRARCNTRVQRTLCCGNGSERRNCSRRTQQNRELAPWHGHDSHWSAVEVDNAEAVHTTTRFQGQELGTDVESDSTCCCTPPGHSLSTAPTRTVEGLRRQGRRRKLHLRQLSACCEALAARCQPRSGWAVAE